MRFVLSLVWCLCATQLASQNAAAVQAQAAAAELEAASVMLGEAERANDRVEALTETIRAFERGLGAMREGLRQAAITETRLTQKLRAKEDEVADLLALMQALDGGASPVLFLHPSGPLGTARAGMLLGEITPALNKRADHLRDDLHEIQAVRTLQADAAARLAAGLGEVQAARIALNQAMALREDLPQRFVEDPVRTGILIASTETLDGFASGLSEIAADELAPAPAALEGEIGALPWPAQGLVLREAGAADAAGVVRPGTILATRPGALVTAPTAATIRYAGPLLDFGNVVILEPQVETLFIFAGLDVVYGNAGQVIAKDTPLGLMGGALPQSDGEVSPLREETGTERSETLYIEVRLDNQTQDPSEWFGTGEDG